MTRMISRAVILAVAMAVSTEAGNGLGISSWAGWRPGRISKAECPELRSVPLILGWDDLEPIPGEYAFDEYVGNRIRAAVDDGLCVTLMIWVRPGTPDWLFEKGVPRVYTDRKVNPLGQKMDRENNLHPYYFHPIYQQHFFKLIEAFGSYVSGLPKELRESILFVQSAEGSTGDGQPYKGNPLEAQYEISPADWNAFRRETWQRYQKAFPGLPIVVNSDANGDEEIEWMFKHMDVIALKQGMFSHGYHVSDNSSRLETFRKIVAEAQKRGIPVLTRGEMDAEMYVYGWSTENVPQALYWSGLFATHCRLDQWNIPCDALQIEANWPAFSFFNRYAGLHDPSDSSRAFCALREGLDASDFNRFPASEFGGSEGDKKDVERYLNIAKAYGFYGARMDDPEKATGGGMINRKRMGYNDVGWDILPGNYCRFLQQIDPGSGDVGLWHVDDSIYGRFARSFEHSAGKMQMRFQLDPAFRADEVEIHIIYLDRGTGSWSVGISGNTVKKIIQKTDSGKWVAATIKMPRDALLNTDLLLNYEGGEDTVFHMVEIENAKFPGSGS